MSADESAAALLAVGLTGGIGSGKSTVADLLVGLGASLIDADRIAREVVAPGAAAYAALLQRFGPEILAPDGTVDRPALAALAFGDAGALADLNAITHPAIGAEMAERRDGLAGTDKVVVLDVPLLTPAHRDLLSLDVVMVVDCDPDLALKRLVEQRAMPEADARARMSAQVGRDERLHGADLVVSNNGTLEALAAEVRSAWQVLVDKAREKSGKA